MTNEERASSIRTKVAEIEELTRQLGREGFRVVLNHSRLHETLNPYGSGVIKVIIDKSFSTTVKL